MGGHIEIVVTFVNMSDLEIFYTVHFNTLRRTNLSLEVVYYLNFIAGFCNIVKISTRNCGATWRLMPIWL